MKPYYSLYPKRKYSFKTFRYVVIFISASIIACTQGGNKIEIDLNNCNKQIMLSEFVDSITYISLEINKNSLFGKLDQILIDDTLLFILDRRQKAIFQFSSNGKYKNKIQNVGRGAEEYISIASFSINKQTRAIYIFDDMQNKVLVYDYNGIYLRHTTLGMDEIIREVHVTDKGTLLCCTPDFMKRGRDGIWEINEKGNFLKTFYEVDSMYRFVFIPDPFISKFNNKFSFYNVFMNEFWSISNDTLSKELTFKLKQMMPDEMLQNEQGSKEGGTGHYYINRRFAETEQKILLQFMSTKNGKVYSVFDKGTFTVSNGIKLINDLDNFGCPADFFNYDNSSICGLIWSESSDSLQPRIQILKLL